MGPYMLGHLLLAVGQRVLCWPVPVPVAGWVLSICVMNCGATPSNAYAEQTEAPTAQADVTSLKDDGTGTDWPGFGRTYGEQHFSPAADINISTVNRLKLAWSLDLDAGPSVTGPIEIGGTIFFARGLSIVYAVDAATGRLLWTYDPKVGEVAGSSLRVQWGIRGIAWWNGKVYTGTVDGRLIALNARSGELVWSVSTLDKETGRYITAAPRVFDGKIIIGHGGADFASVRGYVTAYDAETGKLAWRFFTVPGNPADGFENPAMAMAAKTWAGEWWKYGGGGTVWNAMTYDAETDTVLIGTGNGAPWNRRIRSADKGDNLFLCSIVALNAKTGAYKWHYQTNPGESWDYNAAMDIELADIVINGRPRKVAMTAPKNGFFYVIDRLNGKLISAEPFAETTWAKRIDLKTGRPVEDPNSHYPNGSDFLLRPSSIGAHSWLPMAYSPQTHLAYVPTIDMAAVFNDRGITPSNWNRMPGGVPDGAVMFSYVLDGSVAGLGTSSLLAWDPIQQKAAWRVPTPGFWNGGILATAGRLVFQGQIDSKFNAYAADTGRLLWTFDAQAPVIGPPISFVANGKQYITVLSGMGGAVASFGAVFSEDHLDYRTAKRRVLTFTLDGDAKLPLPIVQNAVMKNKDPNFHADHVIAGRGQVKFAMHCAICHGIDAIGGGNAPDLRQSYLPLDQNAFASIVYNGSLVTKGMPKFDELSATDLDDLREYIRQEAQK
jgi:quinohemoprotein ethanol dehydrogenase